MSIGRSWHVNGAAFVPTQGGFEESTNLSMPKVQVGQRSSFTLQEQPTPSGRASATCIAIAAATAAVVDNTVFTRSPCRRHDRDRSAARTRACRRGASGEFDLVAWGARAGRRLVWPLASRRQRGARGRASLDARAVRPWLRAGYLWASGDGNGEDDRHGTFFQMLPSSRKYALSSVYAQMNLQRRVRAVVWLNLAGSTRVSKYMHSTSPAAPTSGIKAAAPPRARAASSVFPAAPPAATPRSAP